MYRWVAMGTILASLGASSAQTSDDLKCYKMKDPLKLAGTVALDTQPFGADPGCKVSSAKSAKLFCVPATESNAAFITGKKQPLTPVPVFGSDPGDRICYKVKCDGTAADQQVTDQFGTRTVENRRSYASRRCKAGDRRVSSTTATVRSRITRPAFSGRRRWVGAFLGTTSVIRIRSSTRSLGPPRRCHC
jgi:hypothetical protein